MSAPPAARVVVFEDDPELRHLLALVLKAEGCEVQTEMTGGRARTVAADFEPHLAIVDVELDDAVSGFEVARDLRHVDPDVPVMFLTGAASLEERLTGFEVGADDYMTKPFAVAELMARVRALLRRAGPQQSPVERFGDLELDVDAHLVTRNGRDVVLTAMEFGLLHVFLRRPRVVISKSDLLNEVWGFNDYAVNVVEVHMSSLRRKLEEHGPRVIHTVRSVGYVLRPAA